MFSGESFRSSDIRMPENRENMEQKDISSVPSLDSLKSKLQNIFAIEPSETVHAKENITETILVESSFSRSVTLDDGTAINLPELSEYESITETDDNGTIYLCDNELQPDTTYKLNGNIYTTDRQGRIVHCEAKPERSPENPMDINAQLQTGGEDRHLSDQGGHIVGRDLNGDGGAGNLVAMDSRINQSDYKRMENDIKDSLDEGRDVSLTTDIQYSGASKRPDIITATKSADGMITVYKFDNNLDGGLLDEVPENGKEAVNEEISDTKGSISSIKSEYDKNGNLSETMVNITYTDENGGNHRTKVYIDAE